MDFDFNEFVTKTLVNAIKNSDDVQTALGVFFDDQIEDAGINDFADQIDLDNLTDKHENLAGEMEESLSSIEDELLDLHDQVLDLNDRIDSMQEYANLCEKYKPFFELLEMIEPILEKLLAKSDNKAKIKHQPAEEAPILNNWAS